MEKDEITKKFLGGILIGGLLLGGGGLALAGSDDAAASNQASSSAPIHGSRMAGIGKMNSEFNQSVLDSLVSAGTLTQPQADAILTQVQQRETDRQAQMEKTRNMTQVERQAYQEANKSVRVDLWAQLVTDGVITQEQADTIKAAISTNRQAERREKLGTSLAALVEKGTITEPQSSAIEAQMTKFETTRAAQRQSRQAMTEEERQARRDALQGMTAEERQAYREANKPEKVNPLAELVTAGTLTQAQADEVLKAIPFMQGGQGMHHGPGQGEGGMRGPGPRAISGK